MQPSFFFFDYETFGIHPAFDRPSQFAGIRTDLDFNPIEPPINLYCKPPIGYLPNPEAILITGITPQLALQKGVIESEFAKQIHQQLSRPNTCSLGYNSIRFDEEFNRFLFYRNFYDPYDYTYKNGNSRWDIIDLTRACYALRPEGIHWVKDEDGLPTFKLEDLTKANQLNHEQAHDALSDVYATIAIAKLIKTKQPRFFHYFYELRQKNQVKTLIDKTGLAPLVHVSSMLGSYRSNLTLVVLLAPLPHQPNAFIAVDLMGDINALLTLSSEQIRQKLYTKTADLAENNEARMPVKLIHINKAPILAPLNTLRTNDIVRLNLNMEVCESNLKVIKAHFADITSRLFDVFDPNSIEEENLQSQQQAIVNDIFAENQLYARFLTPQDKLLGEKIRQTAFDALEFLELQTQDPRLAPLFLLYKAQNCPQFLTETEQKRWQAGLQHKLTESVIADYIEHLQKLLQQYQSDPNKTKLLQQLWQYCQQLFA